MSDRKSSLPAYIRLPDGLRFAGAADIDSDGRLRFRPKQAISPLPPEGLPLHLVIAGLPNDEEAQLSIPGSVASASARDLSIDADDTLPAALVEALAPESIVWIPEPEVAHQLLHTMRVEGSEMLAKAMRRFVVALGDQLFDLSTSSRYGISGQHAHYDALNMLKRHSEDFIAAYETGLAASLDKTKKDGEGQSFADLEAASARSLDLVALDEMDQKLAVDKIVSSLIDEHRIELECLTIRSALVENREPRKARTPFHPAYIVQAFTDAFAQISDSSVVIQDTLRFFREHYAPTLDELYPHLNKLFIDEGIETDLEEDIRDNGSLLNPVEKRIIKSTTRTRSSDDAGAGSGAGSPGPQREAQNSSTDAGKAPARQDTADEEPAPDPPAHPLNKHDAMYDAVISALDTQRGERGAEEHAAGEPEDGEEPTESAAAAPDAADATDGGTTRATAAALQAAVLSQQQLTQALQGLQGLQSEVTSLGELAPLEQLIREREGGDAQLDRDGANRLHFVDNVFRTLHNNFEVSEDMAPNLARLRVPLARLSLHEPKFFTQPDHPAHQLLDKLSVLASADHTINRSLQNKVSAIVDQIVEDYDEDSEVFATAQQKLDGLLSQQDRVLNRNIERVISGLEGQEKLNRAQQRVEKLLQERLDGERTPQALKELLDGGWRSALVQLALREGEDSVAWSEETALLDELLNDLQSSTGGALPEGELRQMQTRLRALNRRLHSSNPGSVSHEDALRRINATLSGKAPLVTTPYASPLPHRGLPDEDRVGQLPRLNRWLKRVKELEPGARLRYRNKEGQRKHMRLVWVSDDRDRYAFVNERGQKIAELSAIQLARQLSRGARPPSAVDDMSVMAQSVYETLEEAQRTLSFDRNRDSLTQLINGESLLFQIKRTLRHAQARGTEHAFLLLDIDNFKLVNEVFDETSGDQVIGEFARLLAQLNDRRALTARMDEDEFGVLLTYRSMEEARQIADKIRTDIAGSSLAIGSEAVSFTVSIGVAPVAQASDSIESILKQARAALELAKSQGKDQVVVYDLDQQELLDYKRERDSSRRRLDEAMSTDSLVLRAQPIVKSAVDGSERASHHYEILLALRDDDGELQSPQDFIMSAERFGYVTMVDRWVLKETFSWISKLMDAQKEIPELSINLSGTSITDNDFLDYVLEQISEYGVGTSRLCFEITETGAIDNLPRAADFVRTLKNIGCKFSLDDFGTGLASHKYLKELPVDYVKIDGTFITDVHQNSTDFAMAKSINDLAHFLGQKTVAECVEHLETVPALREIGIDYLQGWGIGMPRVLSEITEELANMET